MSVHAKTNISRNIINAGVVNDEDDKDNAFRLLISEGNNPPVAPVVAVVGWAGWTASNVVTVDDVDMIDMKCDNSITP